MNIFSSYKFNKLTVIFVTCKSNDETKSKGFDNAWRKSALHAIGGHLGWANFSRRQSASICCTR